MLGFTKSNSEVTFFENYDIFVYPSSELVKNDSALKPKYDSLFHLQKCITQYVASTLIGGQIL